MSRQITMCTRKDGKLSGEILEGGMYWQIPEFDCPASMDSEIALLERLDIVQIELQLEKDMAGGQ